MKSERYTISAQALKFHLRRFEDLGGRVKPQVLQKHYGISLADLEDNDRRFPLQLVYDSSNRASRLLNEPLLGLKHMSGHYRDFVSLADYFESLAVNVSDLVALLSRYVCLSTDLGILSWSAFGDEVQLRFVATQPLQVTYHQTDAALLMVKQAIENTFALKPKKVFVDHEDAFGLADQYSEFFAVQVLFDQSVNALIFDKTAFFEASKAGATFADAVPIFEKNLQRLREAPVADKDGSVSESAQFMIERLLVRGEPSRADIAKLLGVSVRTLQRKLADEKTSYQALLEDTRKRLVDLYLKNTQYSHTEIALLLGYSESSQFYKAFRKWFGCSPSHYKTT